MVYILSSPANGSAGCLACCWRGVGACPDTLRIGSLAQNLVTVSVNFAGRGKVGGYCGGSDSYVTFSNQGTTLASVVIDVWQAYLDGVWTSSTTVLLYQVELPLSGNSATSAGPNIGIFTACNYGINNTFAADTGVCPATLTATLTITDDGTVVIV